MESETNTRRAPRAARLWSLPLALALGAAACAPATTATGPASPGATGAAAHPNRAADAPIPDPRVGLGAGLFDAEEAIWNLRLLSSTPPPRDFLGVTNSDLAFLGDYAIQGNYNGYQVWDISNPSSPSLVDGYVCPASQSDVSVYRNLLFVSGEGLSGRLDCGTQGVQSAVSQDRLRGLRIFDISDIRNPRNVGNVQTCRGSHTHTLLVDPDDAANVYIYISGSSSVRPEEELPGCVAAPPTEDPNSALFRIEVIRVPLANPSQAAIVSSPRIFEGLTEAPSHGLAPEDRARIEQARAQGQFIVEVGGEQFVMNPRASQALLDSIVVARGGTGAPTAADSATLRSELPNIIARMMGGEGGEGEGPRPGPTQCHDITVYPAIGLAGGACEGYGFLLDISNPIDPRRIEAVSDTNFSYWHSATFDNDGDKVLFTDEWGGGGAPKCRATDPREWGANAIFDVEGNRQLEFESYYKLPAPQTSLENCVAHNGSLIPIPGRDVMVQAWYQGGISVFDWTDEDRPYEIAFHDRGPSDPNEMGSGGSWSAYWYNGVIVSSEIARGLDIFELTPSAHLTQNEIDAAKTVRMDHWNPQMQQRFHWPASFALARAYADQLERSGGLSADRLASVRATLAAAETAAGTERQQALATLAAALEAEVAAAAADGDETGAGDTAKVRMLVDAVRELAADAS